ncbi:TPA: hypothetical protein NNQ18_004599 [Salmonella enterica]|nr:hypothetical protein [Salmonella enterica]HCH9056047.1 hypothetical protein [Salmonella enterica]HCH9129707.1 hypothetical protein [Salmonella enterica]
MKYIKLWYVERAFSNKANKKVWQVKSKAFRTYYTESTKSKAELKAKELNDKFNKV